MNPRCGWVTPGENHHSEREGLSARISQAVESQSKQHFLFAQKYGQRVLRRITKLTLLPLRFFTLTIFRTITSGHTNKTIQTKSGLSQKTLHKTTSTRLNLARYGLSKQVHSVA